MFYFDQCTVSNLKRRCVALPKPREKKINRFTRHENVDIQMSLNQQIFQLR